MGKQENEKSGQESPHGVDMGKIVSMMGPVPFGEEQSDKAVNTADKPSDVIGPTTAPELPNDTKAVSEAAEEVNKELEAMTEGLEKQTSAVQAQDSVEDDQATITAVNDIVSHESDVVLEAEDKAVGITEQDRAKRSFKEWVKYIWSIKKARYGVLAGLGLLVVAIAVLPFSRYFVLNNLGVRASVNVTVLDNSTQLPLKNAKVETRGIEAVTDDEGRATLEHVKLGKTKIHISKKAFAEVYQDATLGWGSNPLGEISLRPAGQQYSFSIVDFLSGKGLEKAQASSGEGNAVSDKDGKIVLTLDTNGLSEQDTLDVEIALDGYRTETVTIPVSSEATTEVKMVPSAQDVFISNRSGKYDIYAIDIDGKNEKKLVAGTGLERPDLALVPEPSSNMVAYAATRENVKNSDGYLLTTLYVFDKTEGSLSKIDQSEQIQIIGWASDHRMIYVKIAAGTSAGNNQRYRLMSFNSKNPSDNKEIASGNAFNDVVLAGNQIIFAPSNYLNDTTPGLFIVNSNGSSKQTITSSEVYNIFRTDYQTVTVDIGGTYSTYDIGGATKLTQTNTPSYENRLYMDGPTGTTSVWFDSRDGKGDVMLYDKGTKKDSVLAAAAGIKLPFYWLTNTKVVYRVNSGSETADYVVSIDGGSPQKVTDLTDIAGQTRWYYY